MAKERQMGLSWDSVKSLDSVMAIQMNLGKEMETSRRTGLMTLMVKEMVIETKTD